MTASILRISADTPLQPLILLVEADLELLASRTHFLTQSDYGVVTAKTPLEIVELQCLGGVQIAILRDALGPVQLRASAETVRRQWPSARILILGYVNFSLDDHLYDENIDPRFDPKKLLDTLKRLNQEAWSRQSVSPEWHLSCDIFTHLAQPSRRSKPQESDPKKEIQATASLSHSRSSPLHRKR